jgi:hypothetical protein
MQEGLIEKQGLATKELQRAGSLETKRDSNKLDFEFLEPLDTFGGETRLSNDKEKNKLKM